MLAFFTSDTRGFSDRLLADFAQRLLAKRIRLSGAIQVNVERDSARRCDMELRILQGTEVIRISQNLGSGSRGCRLDPDGLERAAGLVERALSDDPDLLIINKFGKQEVEGRGFRPLIGQALAGGVPVLTSVNRSNREPFLDFCGEFADEIPATADALLAWYSQIAGTQRTANAS